MGEHIQEIVSFPTILTASGCNAGLDATYSLRGRVVRQAEQDGQVVLRMSPTDVTLVLM
ncbi:MAG: hypothetical protein OXH93_20735 [Caldilineaceae bacterium]|nr:hypothetical protein [Caldilineaceae bacterium]MDE0464857.1 hypothetical protein [Caldilineaceae bacterium]